MLKHHCKENFFLEVYTNEVMMNFAIRALQSIKREIDSGAFCSIEIQEIVNNNLLIIKEKKNELNHRIFSTYKDPL